MGVKPHAPKDLILPRPIKESFMKFNVPPGPHHFSFAGESYVPLPSAGPGVSIVLHQDEAVFPAYGNQDVAAFRYRALEGYQDLGPVSLFSVYAEADPKYCDPAYEKKEAPRPDRKFRGFDE